ncbi:MAG: fibronectin type III domain-containing protein [Rhodothermales bacterium]
MGLAQVAPDCDLDAAESSYDVGRFGDAISMLEACLDRREELTREELADAHRLLGYSYAALNLVDRIREAARELLQLVPDYQTNPVTEPPPFPQIIEELRAPVSLAAEASGAGIRLSWEANAIADLETYHIFRGETRSSLARIDAIPAAETIYTDSTVAEGTYFYAVQAVTAGGNEGLQSLPVAVRVAARSPLAPPSSLTAVPEENRVRLSWKAGAGDLAAYRIYRGRAPTDLLLVGSVPASDAAYVDVDVEPGAAYVYALRSVGTGGEESATSETAEVRLPALSQRKPWYTRTWMLAGGGAAVAGTALYFILSSGPGPTPEGDLPGPPSPPAFRLPLGW